MANDALYLYLGVYESPARAESDFEDLGKLHRAGLVGNYDAAIVEKDDQGNVHMKKHEKPTQHGAWTGIGVGALLAVLFPPSILGGAVVGGLAGALTGHLWKGMSRADVKEMGELLDSGDAALIVIGSPEMREQTERILAGAQQRIVKELGIKHYEFADALEEAKAQAAAGSEKA